AVTSMQNLLRWQPIT
ncbi:aromatic amino acid lyase family protein, partial [Vibrio parahaemolyticus V-223/04]